MRAVKSYRSPKTEIKETSKISQKGVFAKEKINKDEIVFIKGGHILNLDEAKNIDKLLGEECCLRITEKFFIGPKDKEEWENTKFYINHSCNPNIGPSGEITFVALRDIYPGEELCYDYATTTPRNYKFKCNCESKNCRGVITSNDWKSKELQERYGDYFILYILKKIKEGTHAI